ncbi:carbon monoxide dehydrogenase [Bordetella holmesii]|uniref:SRPBCC family protein n=1 Tax=Bordetella holmesii TaxID=35814 RepID=UPI00043AD668|nr:carbon monoxide dehydrogenase subunit G [Bordetella holmesii]AHV94695.1 carbon monoxide dehydrogenase subunit G family protein [Bordetella holmesii ATCC 51541]AMD49488.1 carbon monoxide dehydrogenase subunit G [Bordetella holmesii F627]AUL21106.1 carbon monoxide dehydrogenase [Bordetella holmesii]AUL24443.1 carbon monoxide dehydrogenase [Bordetella holmesii]AUL27773.1 carbon monoxide dehydrogenase [Bordetella holmesii]
MRITDAQWVPSTPHQTWAALFDPGVLQRCLPGCIHVRRVTDTEYAITVRAKVGGLDAEYAGEVLVSDAEAAQCCSLAFDGKGAAAGLAIGTADVRLSPKDNGTRISYVVTATAGGKLAALGEPAILKAAGKIIDRFFTAFGDHLASVPRQAPPPPPPAAEPRGLSSSRWSWVMALAVVVMLVGYHTLFK